MGGFKASSAESDLAAAGYGPEDDIDEVVVYYSLIGAASLAYANAPEARHLGCDTLAAEFVDRHADALVAMLCGPNPTEGTSS